MVTFDGKPQLRFAGDALRTADSDSMTMFSVAPDGTVTNMSGGAAGHFSATDDFVGKGSTISLTDDCRIRIVHDDKGALTTKDLALKCGAPPKTAKREVVLLGLAVMMGLAIGETIDEAGKQ